MRTRPVLSLMCGALLGCGAPSSATNDETAGHGSSGGGSGEGTLGHGETGGAPTSGETGSTGAPASSTGTTGPLESTGTSTTDGSDGGCNFLCPSETGGCGAAWGEGLEARCSECDVWAQDCPQGQKCTAWNGGDGASWDATRCVMVTGDGAPGEPCMTVGGGLSGVDDCAEGVMCWDVVENNMGFCVALCTGTPDAPICPGAAQCWFNGEMTLNLCHLVCDPLLQDCAGTNLCIPTGEEFECAPDASGDEGQAHDDCDFHNECDKGLVCLDTADASSACDPAAAGCCEPFCEFPEGACPAADQQCVQWFDPRTLPMDDPKLEIGVCRIPP